MTSDASHDEGKPGRRHIAATDGTGFAQRMIPVPVRTVIFDVGNVLFFWSLRIFFGKLIHDTSELDWFLSNVVTEKWHFQHDAGRPLDDMVRERKSAFPAHAALIDAYATRFNESIHAPVPGMDHIVDDLTARGIPIFGITNFGAEFWAGFRPTQPIFDHFTDIVVSGEEKLMKPDPAIYALALRRFALAPGEGLFVDDRLENIEAGAANGFIGHQFKDAACLRATLEQLQLL